MSKPVSRREALLWIAALTGSAGAGVCGVGGLVAFLLARRRSESDGDGTSGLSTPSPALPTAPASSPVATIPPPAIVTREQWNARPINHNAEAERGFASASNPFGWLDYSGDLAAVYSTVAIHHSYPIRRDTGTMREIQDLHLDVRKWADIGYHYGIGADGTIYAGRDIKSRGSNVAGYNTGTVGVVVIGDFMVESPTASQIASLQTLVNWLAVTYTLSHLAGHGEFDPKTTCPGANLKPFLDMLAQSAGLQRGIGGYVPPPTYAPTPTCC